jgi:homogentisate 1,2-dioxygenase
MQLSFRNFQIEDLTMNAHTLPDGMVRAVSSTSITDGYMPGFANDFETEALTGALPQGQNSPQKCNYGLYAEQFSGSAFTKPHPERTWCYRIRPSVKHTTRFQKIDVPHWKSAPHVLPDVLSLGQYRWDPVPHGEDGLTWVTGMRTVTTAGDVNTQAGMASHIYLVTQSMREEYFFSADGELLVVPQEGKLRFCTELGIIDVEPKEIAVLPRGLLYRVEILEGPCRGFVCENYGVPFTLPNRGPIGANCLANPRDFKTPVAAFEDREAPSRVIIKWCGQFHATPIGHSPLDVVAWHGNYAPYKYDLRTYSPVGAILFDHPDPSIFTVLTAPSGLEGTANIDFVLFRERWLVAENSFRPPWYHKNVMSELMGNIYGIYDAKPKGFVPGGMSLHNCMLPHGPDRNAFEGASNSNLNPEKLDRTMSFMFETRFPQHLTEWAAKNAPLQDDYIDCWESLDKKFDGTPGVKK